MKVYANQGYRDAWVLVESFENKSLVEYVMPNGTTALRITPSGDYMSPFYKSVAYRSLPKKWLRELVISDELWEGCPQQANDYVPSPRELWIEKYGEFPNDNPQ